MNSQNESKKFTHEYSRNEITFLDVTVYRNHDKLQVKTFIKPTNKQLYISNSSHHPPGSTKDVAFGRYLRTNSEKKHFYKMLFLHKRNLLKRGYPRSLINETMRKVRFSMREDRLKPKDQVGTGPQTDRFSSPGTVQGQTMYSESYANVGPGCTRSMPALVATSTTH